VPLAILKSGCINEVSHISLCAARAAFRPDVGEENPDWVKVKNRVKWNLSTLMVMSTFHASLMFSRPQIT